MKSPGRGRALALLLFAGAWLGGYILLARYGVFLLPKTAAQKLTLTSYLGIVQMLVTGAGLACAWRLTRSDNELRQTLLPATFHAANVGYALLLAPLVYVLAHSLGMYLAFDTLIAELASQGARAVQQQTGEFGRSAALDSLVVVLPFTVLIAPLGEELLFRGGIYGAVQNLGATVRDVAAPDSAPDSFVIAGLPRKGAPLVQRITNLLASGWGALIVSSLAFGIMHADTPGGMGIVRVTSASVLGVCCGLARLKGASMIPAVTLHAAYNLLSLGTLRGWFTSESWPSKYALPTLLIPLAGFGLIAGALLFVMQKHSAKRGIHA
jgi:membrane protease YdiL (CAAX protease family)